VKKISNFDWRDRHAILGLKMLLVLILGVAWVFGGLPQVPTSAQQPKSYFLYFPLVARIEFQTGPSIFTSSYYMKTIDPGAAYTLGCALGARDAKLDGIQDNVVVLDYGRAIYADIFGNGQMAYGTRLFITAQKVSMQQIALSAEKFGEGYYTCTDQDTFSKVNIGIGTNNYEYDGCPNCSADFNHGREFALMVNSVNDWFLQKGFTRQVSASAANDIELSWISYARSRDWLDGYDSVNQYAMLNFGAIPGCPYLASPGAQCGSYPYLWSKEEVWYVIWGAKPVYPLPEIYATSGVNAQQWFLMSLYSYTAHGLAIEFPGVMTQSQSCPGTYTPDQECYYLNNSPLVGWTQLQDLLNSDPRTAHPIRLVTDIKYQ
jgi:hypothetical protein